ERDIVVSNPCAIVKAPGEEREGERVLQDVELQSLWERLPDPSCALVVDLAERLMEVTGRSRGEVAGAEGAEFDLAARTWSLPAVRSRNGRACEIMLRLKATEVIEQIRRRTGNGRWLFPARHYDEPMVLMTPAIGMAVRLLLVTAQRRVEVAEAPWTEFDLGN